jgi:hypothetical protein
MKDDISIPLGKEEDLVAADKRRYSYSVKRDLQASEFNEAITMRLAAEKNLAKRAEESTELQSGIKSK